MKKLLILSLFLASVSITKAQSWQQLDLLSVPIVQINSNNAGSGTIGVTNLAPFSAVNTNAAGVVWTNSDFNRVIVVAGSNDNVNLFKDAPIWVDRNASSVYPAPYVEVFLSGAAKSTNSINFVMIPLLDNDPPSTNPNGAPSTNAVVIPGPHPSTASVDIFTFNVVPNGATAVCIRTNLPAAGYPIYGWRLQSVTQTNLTTINGETYLRAVRVCGWKP